ncbi:MAG: GNAT family N-acetyltransferase [Clostridiales bacterium]|jgi:predicted acetyltransferase|nr:GNAT family N-acetyltransferase [Clostridiales bacterium]
MDKIKLTLPSQEMKPAVLAFRDEFKAKGEDSIPGSRDLMAHESFLSWIGTLNAKSDASVPSITYLAFRQPENTLVGIVDIRHFITEETLHEGHITFSIRPSERKKGVGTEVLRLALVRARELGAIEAVIACSKGNKPAKRVIKKNGLERYEPENAISGISYYRIDL